MSTIREKLITDIALLDQCIAHWVEMRDKPFECLERGIIPGPHSCPLCRVYLDETMDDLCVGCPIRDWVHASGCCCTPYAIADEAFEMFTTKKVLTKQDFRLYMDAEIAFLGTIRVALNERLNHPELEINGLEVSKILINEANPDKVPERPR